MHMQKRDICLILAVGKRGDEIMKRLLFLMGLVLFLATTICCGGGGDGDSDDGGTCANAAGTWEMTERVDATDCGDGTYTQHRTYTVTQSGCTITVVPSDHPNLSFSGSMSGNQISWSGSWPEDGGTTTANISATINGDSISGSFSWSWTDGTDSCNGTTRINGTRLWAAVRFYNDLKCDDNSFAATLTVCGQTFTSYSTNWSSCEDIAPGTCTVSVHAQTEACGTLSTSGSYTFEEGSVYSIVYTIKDENLFLGVNIQTGDCSTNTPWLTGASELGVDLGKIEAVMDTFESDTGSHSIDSYSTLTVQP
jgi:hypothetical protein